MPQVPFYVCLHRCIGECGSTLYVGLTGIVRKLIQTMGMVRRILSIFLRMSKARENITNTANSLFFLSCRSMTFSFVRHSSEMFKHCIRILLWCILKSPFSEALTG